MVCLFPRQQSQGDVPHSDIFRAPGGGGGEGVIESLRKKVLACLKGRKADYILKG